MTIFFLLICNCARTYKANSNPEVMQIKALMVREDAITTLNHLSQEIYVQSDVQGVLGIIPKSIIVFNDIGGSYSFQANYQTQDYKYDTKQYGNTKQTTTTTTTYNHAAMCNASFNFSEINKIRMRNDWSFGSETITPFKAITLISLISDRWPNSNYFTIVTFRKDKKFVLAALELLCPNLEKKSN